MITYPAFSSAATAWRWLMPGSFGIGLHRHFFALDFDVEPFFDLGLRREVFRDGALDIRERVFSRLPLRIAPRQVIAPDGEPLFRLNKGDAVCHVYSCKL